jgi:hypothetical protein
MVKAISSKNLKSHQDRLAARAAEHAKAQARVGARELIRAQVEKTPIEQMSNEDVRRLLGLLLQHLGIV